jgi:tRNA (guanine37-N1)-methyltransferase
LSNERLEIAKRIKKKDSVLVMFAGVGVYPIVIYKNKKCRKVVGVELGRECCKYFEENLKLNKIIGKVKIIQGDVKRKVSSKLGKFDVVVMARPNLKESFLKEGFSVCKKGSLLVYYGFGHEDELDGIIGEIKKEAKENRKRIKILRKVKAGDIAPYKFRYRIEIKIL